jgi:NAD(P)-dependent dehydrogenase (short-subunit alcohol dehydrogenase family)
LAQALAPRIRVNGVGPGPTFPNPRDGEAGLEREAAGTLLERRIDPAEIAAAVRFVVDTPSITGQMLALDSGQHLAWQTPDIVDNEG